MARWISRSLLQVRHSLGRALSSLQAFMAPQVQRDSRPNEAARCCRRVPLSKLLSVEISDAIMHDVIEHLIRSSRWCSRCLSAIAMLVPLSIASTACCHHPRHQVVLSQFAISPCLNMCDADLEVTATSTLGYSYESKATKAKASTLAPNPTPSSSGALACVNVPSDFMKGCFHRGMKGCFHRVKHGG